VVGIAGKAWSSSIMVCIRPGVEKKKTKRSEEEAKNGKEKNRGMSVRKTARERGAEGAGG